MKEIHTNSEYIFAGIQNSGLAAWPLFITHATRNLERIAAASLPPHTLMKRAGLELAKFALAVKPHADVIWIICGPGNNGGDGLEAAFHLKSWGKNPVVTCMASEKKRPLDANIAYQTAVNAGVTFSNQAPEHFDLCIDAIFGIGGLRDFDEDLSALISGINTSRTTVISVDIPTGLNADSGSMKRCCVCADFTLSLLTLKPGLFTANGRDVCGQIWFNDLGIQQTHDCIAQLNPFPQKVKRTHASHKGTYGDVAIIGGDFGMSGASMLAAKAALYGGAGRIYLTPLDLQHPFFNDSQPELMYRNLADLSLESMTVVAGCGGGAKIGQHMHQILERSARLVIDADAINSIAESKDLQAKLLQRMEHTTVLTPHPLEAARLLGLKTEQIQENRLNSSKTMADRFRSIVVLKGSGSIVSAPTEKCRINITGNARLATAGTGDVLAGLIGAKLAFGRNAFEQTCAAVYEHGEISNQFLPNVALTAQRLAESLA